MIKLFEVKGGKFKILPTLNPKYIKGFLIISIVGIVISSLAGFLKLNEKDLWKIYNLILQQFGLQQEIPINIDNPKRIEAQIELEVDKAIEDYWKTTGELPAQIYKPKYIEESNDESVCYSDQCKALAPPMRLCASWLDSCPKD